jgi:hypothetical protein
MKAVYSSFCMKSEHERKIQNVIRIYRKHKILRRRRPLLATTQWTYSRNKRLRNNRTSIVRQRLCKVALSTIQVVLPLGPCKVIIEQANSEVQNSSRERTGPSLRNWQLQEMTRRFHSAQWFEVIVHVLRSVARKRTACSSDLWHGQSSDTAIQRISLCPRILANFRNNIIFLRWGVVSPPPNPKSGGPPIVGYSGLLIQYIRRFPPYLEAVSSIRNPRMRHAAVTRDPRNMGPVEGSCERGVGPSGCLKFLGISWKPAHLAASQEELSSVSK